MKLFTYTILGMLLFIPLASLNAQTPCGNIIVSEDVANSQLPQGVTPIMDCTDPFHETTSISSPYTLYIDGQSVTEGEHVNVAAGGTGDFVIDGDMILTGIYDGVSHVLFLHEGNDYRAINTEPLEPTEEDYRQLALEFFPEGTDVEPYVETIISGEYYFEDETMDNLLWEFDDYFYQHFIPQIPPLRAGTYTLISNEYSVRATQRNLLDKLYAYLVPTAHAQTPGNYVFTLTFTIEEGPLVAECCSSVVFLPGIKGSVLKKDNDTLWPPTVYSDDVIQLALNDEGESIEDIHVDGMLANFYGTPIYDRFGSFLNTLIVDEIIMDWEPLPYDWRFSPERILEEGVQTENGVVDLIERIEILAEESNTGQVTIVAHSMGGLMGKAIIKKLEEEGKADLIDSFVMVGSPQLGTPQAIASMLHGNGESILFGLIVDSATPRLIAQNMPSSYNLLPSKRYFEEVDDPVITFNPNDWYTQDWISHWGGSLNIYNKYLEFLTGQGVERSKPLPTMLSLPEVLKSDHISDAETFHDEYDSYEFPENVRVVQVAGWGQPTIKSVEYKSRHLVFPAYEPDFTIEGDSTVVYPSAISSMTNETFFFNQENEINIEHKDLLSAHSIQNLIQSIIEENEINVTELITNVKPEVSDAESRLLVSAHSPVILGVHDDEGNFTGIDPEQDLSEDFFIAQEIPGSAFREFGDSQYIFLPKDGTYTFSYKGTGNGSTTIEIETFENDIRTPIVSYTDIPTSVETKATFEVNASSPEAAQIEVDQNGDGTTDLTIKSDQAESELEPTPELSRDELIELLETTIKDMNLKRGTEKHLLAKVKVLKKLSHIKLKILQKIIGKVSIKVTQAEVKHLKKKKKISKEDANVINDILNKIKETL